MSKKRLYVKAIAIVLVLALGVPWISFGQVSALAPVAKITQLVGKVTVTRAGRPIPGTKDMDIMIGDEIKTESSSEAAIKYKDGSLLFIRENSEISIQPLPGKPTVGRRIKIMVGRVWARIRPNKAYQTEFETPAAVAAVRGTDVEVSVVTGSEWRIVEIGCADGVLVIIYEEDGELKEVTLEEGQKIVFRIGETIIILAYLIGSISGSGLLSLGTNIVPWLLALGGGSLGTAVYLIIIASPSGPE